MRTVANRDQSRNVIFYAQGVQLRAPSSAVAGAHKRAKRGEVTGWSRASRRRMRRFLLENEPPAQWTTSGVTLTIPGPVLPDDAEKAIFSHFSKNVLLAGWCMVWRLELQGRGARHWHGIISAPLPYRQLCCKTSCLWHAALDSIGPRTYDPPAEVGDMIISGINHLSMWPGADRRACQSEEGGGSGSWYRYICDHASKSKQEQVAAAKGRHWGIVGRSHFRPATPQETASLSDTEFFRFLRAFQRLTRPSVKAACIFGRKLGWRSSRGSRGISEWFSRPDTVRRLVVWARSLPSEPGESAPF